MKLEVGNAALFSRVEPSNFGSVLPMSKVSTRVRLYALLLGLDCVGVVAAFALANLLRFGLADQAAGVNNAALLLPLYLAVAINRNVYSSDLFNRWRHAAHRALTSLGGAVGAILFVAFYLRAGTHLSREVFTIGTALAALWIFALRYALHRFGPMLFAGDPFATLLVTDGVALEPGPHAVAVDAAALALNPDVADPHALDRVGRLLKRADRVVVACPEHRRAAWAAVLKGANIRGEIVTPELSGLGSLGASRFANAPTLIVSVGPLSLRHRALKRGLDLFLSIAALTVLAPLLALTALAVKLESSGPIFFVQPRLGRGNRLFPMYKFRSMRAELCDVAGAQSTARGDARVTRVGRIIRATSIDELPQLLNVLKGDMSIVGPRPHALGSLAGDKLFWEVDQRYWHRHATKPGITGLAQVRGFRGATHLTSDLTYRLQADLDYLNGWTLWRDISILLATFKVVLHKNAY
ncbi:sugar transferase [Sphingomonas morindae]|uniref:Sugar transferase n=1 Tax=Sphingomonas morindae TaxID=1541170 RepID=A0ABY4X9K6_9SPHN|nr:sugar transferase [Sphingomonas morindae]USI73615.1 sugar transferase [Sphingomonas morindae]